MQWWSHSTLHIGRDQRQWFHYHQPKAHSWRSSSKNIVKTEPAPLPSIHPSDRCKLYQSIMTSILVFPPELCEDVSRGICLLWTNRNTSFTYPRPVQLLEIRKGYVIISAKKRPELNTDLPKVRQTGRFCAIRIHRIPVTLAVVTSSCCKPTGNASFDVWTPPENLWAPSSSALRAMCPVYSHLSLAILRSMSMTLALAWISLFLM